MDTGLWVPHLCGQTAAAGMEVALEAGVEPAGPPDCPAGADLLGPAAGRRIPPPPFLELWGAQAGGGHRSCLGENWAGIFKAQGFNKEAAENWLKKAHPGGKFLEDFPKLDQESWSIHRSDIAKAVSSAGASAPGPDGTRPRSYTTSRRHSRASLTST